MKTKDTPVQNYILKHLSLKRKDVRAAITSGWDFYIFVTKDDLVYRIARRKAYSEKLKTEVRFLKEFAKVSPLAVPQPLEIFCLPNGKWGVVYKYIKGVPFTAKLVRTLSQRKKESCAQMLAEFLFTLHSFSLKKAKTLGVKELALKETLERELKLRIKRVVFPRLNKRQRLYIENVYYDFLLSQEKFPVEKRVTHGDFFPEHILFDLQKNKLSGILDFADIEISDPAIDFPFKVVKYPKAFYEFLLTKYTLAKGTAFLERVEFYNQRVLIKHLLHCLAKYRDVYRFRKALKQLRVSEALR